MAFTLRLTEDEDLLLAEQAQAEGISKHEAARRAIVERAARLRQDQAVARSAAAGALRYADLLDRLGKA